LLLSFSNFLLGFESRVMKLSIAYAISKLM
jgi:hypothetical protein